MQIAVMMVECVKYISTITFVFVPTTFLKSIQNIYSWVLTNCSTG